MQTTKAICQRQRCLPVQMLIVEFKHAHRNFFACAKRVEPFCVHNVKDMVGNIAKASFSHSVSRNYSRSQVSRSDAGRYRVSNQQNKSSYKVLS